MDGPTHYTMAEALIAEAVDDLRKGDPDGRVAFLIAIGQVHATLAAAAATALGASVTEASDWEFVAGSHKR